MPHIAQTWRERNQEPGNAYVADKRKASTKGFRKRQPRKTETFRKAQLNSSKTPQKKNFVATPSPKQAKTEWGT